MPHLTRIPSFRGRKGSNSKAAVYATRELRNYGSYAEALYEGNKEMYQKLVKLTNQDYSKKSLEVGLKEAFSTLSELQTNELETCPESDGSLHNTIYADILSDASNLENEVQRDLSLMRIQLNKYLEEEKNRVESCNPLSNEKKVIMCFKWKEEQYRRLQAARAKVLASGKKLADVKPGVDDTDLKEKHEKLEIDVENYYDDFEAALSTFHMERMTHEANVLNYVSAAHKTSEYPINIIEWQLRSMESITRKMDQQVKELKEKRCNLQRSATQLQQPHVAMANITRPPVSTLRLEDHLRSICECMPRCTISCSYKVAVPIEECCRVIAVNVENNTPWIEIEGILIEAAKECETLMIRALLDANFALQAFRTKYHERFVEQIEELDDRNPVHAFAVADALKMYLADLRPPLLSPSECFVSRWCNVCNKHRRNKDEQLLISSMQSLLKDLPLWHQNNVHFLFSFLRKVIHYADKNKTSDIILSAAFMPYLLNFASYSQNDNSKNVDAKKLDNEDQLDIFRVILHNLEVVLPDVSYMNRNRKAKSSSLPKYLPITGQEQEPIPTPRRAHRATQLAEVS